LWTDGYFVTTVGKYGNEDVLKNYIKNQGDDLYKELYKMQFKEEQLNLW
jgi:REP element-mobilizing transposase RayT